MDSFEKEFPNLKEVRMEGFVEDDGTLGYELKDNGEYIQVFDVRKHCLDKQRVREFIEKEKEYRDEGNSKEWHKGYQDCLEFIEKEWRL